LNEGSIKTQKAPNLVFCTCRSLHSLLNPMLSFEFHFPSFDRFHFLLNCKLKIRFLYMLFQIYWLSVLHLFCTRLCTHVFIESGVYLLTSLFRLTIQPRSNLLINRLNLYGFENFRQLFCSVIK
jgi:hypothetical protein